MGETQTKEKAYKTKNKKVKIWENLLNQRKIDFFNAIKSEETAKTYKGFNKKDDIFISRKFKEKKKNNTGHRRSEKKNQSQP